MPFLDAMTDGLITLRADGMRVCTFDVAK
jgi:hypothetical protein